MGERGLWRALDAYRMDVPARFVDDDVHVICKWLHCLQDDRFYMRPVETTVSAPKRRDGDGRNCVFLEELGECLHAGLNVLYLGLCTPAVFCREIHNNFSVFFKSMDRADVKRACTAGGNIGSVVFREAALELIRNTLAHIAFAVHRVDEAAGRGFQDVASCEADHEAQPPFRFELRRTWDLR